MVLNIFFVIFAIVMTRILFVCHGNICRSPMAEFILKALVKAKGLEGRTITEYKGVVFGEVISGVNFLRDFAASIRHGRQEKIRFFPNLSIHSSF